MTTNSSASQPERDSKGDCVRTLPRFARRPLHGVALLMALLFAFPAVAQEDEGQFLILIVDMQRIKTDSAAGRDMLAKSENIRVIIREELAERERAVREDEQQLAVDRPALEQQEFRDRVVSFEAQVIRNREYAEQESRRLQLLLSKASELLRKKATQVLTVIMRERGAKLLLDSSQIVLSVDSLNITDEAITRLDAVLPEMPFRLEVFDD